MKATKIMAGLSAIFCLQVAAPHLGYGEMAGATQEPVAGQENVIKPFDQASFEREVKEKGLKAAVENALAAGFTVREVMVAAQSAGKSSAADVKVVMETAIDFKVAKQEAAAPGKEGAPGEPAPKTQEKAAPTAEVVALAAKEVIAEIRLANITPEVITSAASQTKFNTVITVEVIKTALAKAQEQAKSEPPPAKTETKPPEAEPKDKPKTPEPTVLPPKPPAADLAPTTPGGNTVNNPGAYASPSTP